MFYVSVEKHFDIYQLALESTLAKRVAVYSVHLYLCIKIYSLFKTHYQQSFTPLIIFMYKHVISTFKFILIYIKF